MSSQNFTFTIFLQQRRKKKDPTSHIKGVKLDRVDPLKTDQPLCIFLLDFLLDLYTCFFIEGYWWHMAGDMRQVTFDMWHVTGETRHVTCRWWWAFSKSFRSVALAVWDIFTKDKLINESVTKVFLEQPRLHWVC